MGKEKVVREGVSLGCIVLYFSVADGGDPARQ